MTSFTSTPRVRSMIGLPLPAPQMHPRYMTEVSAFPDRGEVVFDVRDDGRFLRYRWHPERGVGAVSLWRGDRCSGTFQIAREDLPKLIQALVESAAAATTASAQLDLPATG